MLRLDLCDYSNAYIVVNRIITFVGTFHAKKEKFNFQE